MDCPLSWHIVTGGYPPQPGGVSDYTRLLARGLKSAGDNVAVWAPAYSANTAGEPGVSVHRLPGHYGPRALATLSRALACAGDSRLLVQYVPHAFGLRAMNLPFCMWLNAYARRRRGIAVIFHEVNFPFLPGHPAQYRVLAAATSLMARLVARSADQIFVAASAWAPRLRRYVADRSITWMPVPSTIPLVSDRDQIDAARRRYAPGGGFLAGHFGSYSAEVGAPLREIIAPLLAGNAGITMILIGANSCTFRDSCVRAHPELAPRIVATDALAPEQISLALSSCDVMLQPFPDGVTGRRTSVMAALDHARAVVASDGVFTESIWRQRGALALVPVGQPAAFAAAVTDLIEDEPRRRRISCAGKALYLERFALRHTITALREAPCA